ncbi:MAG: type II/IV secretion system protein [Opitutaceae bacterium]|nr:type II/IV secretion system protein [Opitutaceae bacterium]
MPDLFISTSSRDAKTVQWLNSLFLSAVRKGASDIHFEDMEQDTRVRFRINGTLTTIESVPRMLSIDAMNKIRARTDLPLSDLRRPLDGRFSLDYKNDGVCIDVRASFTPIIHGTSLVCRVLDQRNTLRTIDEIEMTDEVRKWVSILLHEPHGLFLVSGPTGSGKTSTLYAILNALRDETRKISTIEDPVEYRVPGLCQTNIEGNLTFADVLRAELRQDPDVILVGEIRDAETAQIALQASMTGHLVLSTLHANDAAASVGRMLDLGADPSTLGAALRGVLAQRLVRRLAERHDMAPPTEAEIFWLQNHDIEVSTDNVFGVPVENEGEDGYDGRVPVMELIVIDRTVRNVLPLKDPKAIRTVARRQPQYQTLAASAADLARRGLTSVTEAYTVSSISEHLRSFRTLPERLIELGKLSPYQYDVCKQIQLEASRMGRRMTLEDVLVSQRYVSQSDIDEVTDL